MPEMTRRGFLVASAAVVSALAIPAIEFTPTPDELVSRMAKLVHRSRWIEGIAMGPKAYAMFERWLPLRCRFMANRMGQCPNLMFKGVIAYQSNELYGYDIRSVEIMFPRRRNAG